MLVPLLIFMFNLPLGKISRLFMVSMIIRLDPRERKLQVPRRCSGVVLSREHTKGSTDKGDMSGIDFMVHLTTKSVCLEIHKADGL